MIQRLFRPFDRVSGPQALAFGLIVLVVTALIAARSGLRSDSLLDLQFGPPAPEWQLIVQGLINWLAMAAALLVAGRWLSRERFASLDLFGVQAAARWPLLASVIYLSIPPLGGRIRALTERLLGAMPTEQGQVMAYAAYMGDAFLLTLLGLPLLAFLGWTLWLMWHGYQAVTGVRGPQAAFSFAGALVAAYILSTLGNLLLA